MPYCAHSAVNGRRRPSASATNSSRIDMTLGTLQGTATSWLHRKCTNLTYLPGLFLTHQPGPYPTGDIGVASVSPVSPVVNAFWGFYSCLMASIGLRRAARRAGYVPNVRP